MTRTKHDYNRAVLALISAFLFGASTPIAKLLLGITDPLLLAGLLYLGSGAGLALVATGGRSLGLGRSEAPLRARDLPWLGAIALFGGIVGPALLMWGLMLTPASTGALLLNTEAVATMAIAWVVFRENVDRRIFLGAMAILAGAVLLSWPEAAGTGPQLSWGSVLIVLACVSWGIDNNLTRKVSAADPLQIAMIKGLAAGAVNFALALAGGARRRDSERSPPRPQSVSSATGSAWSSLCWVFGTWERRARAPTSRRLPLSAPPLRFHCLARHRPSLSWARRY
jgi:drug/metabolite transporter (DMT)-like permease